MTNAHVPVPDLDVRDDTPVSTSFGDVYFSHAGGIAETEHVFLAGNGLPERWQGRARFTIAELGFGTGLNFLTTLKHFRKTADANATLHYLAVEKFPFTSETLHELLDLQPELKTEAAELLTAYPLRLPGAHRIHFGNILLTLFFGEVHDWLNQITTPIDAWYLDGFSPAKNPDMWSDEILAQLGKLNAANATFATFTAAGHVKRGLQAAGFTVEKIPGFGHKREMLRGAMQTESQELRKAALPSPKSTLIIGAGIAGATLARALAERGHRVTIIERGIVASGASGNAAGVLFPQLTKQWNISTAWYFTAYGFALRSIARWKNQGLQFAGATPGMLRLPRHGEEERQLENLGETLGLDPSIVHWIDRDAASSIAGVNLQSGAAYFPQGSWISPPELCRALLQHENIMLREHTAATSLKREGGNWIVTLENSEHLTAQNCCVTSAVDAATLLPQYNLRLNAVGGQVSEIAAGDVAAELRSILCHKGYVIPCGERVAFHGEPLGQGSAASAVKGIRSPSIINYLTGATYHRDDMLAVTQNRHAENIAELNNILPGWHNGNIINGRSSLRATTPDRMPYIGALDEGLYLSTGHGSRGLLSAPLAAEIIASALCNEPAPVTAPLARAVSPLRFRK